jgi:uncharacterized protein (TIGR02145 family)
MTTNLRVTKYRDGAPIQLATSNVAWNIWITPLYCWYNNDETTNKNTYGALYNWFAVNTGKLCPTGWHVPSDLEFTTLTTYLGSESVAGGKLKETGTSHWKSPNTDATNTSGFTAVPGGVRIYSGGFFDIGTIGYWWTTTAASSNTNAVIRNMNYDRSSVWRTGDPLMSAGHSVRCIKD